MIDRAEKMVNTFYPGYTVEGIDEVLIAGRGWTKSPYGWNHTTLRHLRERGVTHVNLKVKSPYGSIHYPDFSMEQLGYGQLPREPVKRVKRSKKRNDVSINYTFAAWLMYGDDLKEG